MREIIRRLCYKFPNLFMRFSECGSLRKDRCKYGCKCLMWN
jgi:hypothetical protein